MLLVSSLSPRLPCLISVDADFDANAGLDSFHLISTVQDLRRVALFGSARRADAPNLACVVATCTERTYYIQRTNKQIYNPSTALAQALDRNSTVLPLPLVYTPWQTIREYESNVSLSLRAQDSSALRSTKYYQRKRQSTPPPSQAKPSL